MLTTHVKRVILRIQHSGVKESVAMTQNEKQIKRIAELNSIFLTLDDKGQDSVLMILRSLDFAQTVMNLSQEGEKSSKNRPA